MALWGSEVVGRINPWKCFKIRNKIHLHWRHICFLFEGNLQTTARLIPSKSPNQLLFSLGKWGYGCGWLNPISKNEFLRDIQSDYLHISRTLFRWASGSTQYQSGVRTSLKVECQCSHHLRIDIYDNVDSVYLL
jgi:hypothetical protein